VNLLRQI